jgi:type VI secretion system protein ImpE
VDARETLRSGDARGALELLKAEVRKSPRDAKLRTFLFQMFCLTGEWERALTQLTTSAELDAIGIPMQQAYQAAIRCEVLREKVFRGERSPTVLGDPGEWVPLLIEATRLLGEGKHAEAAALRDRAFDMAPETPGRVNGKGFAWIADADPRLGPVAELFINGNYMWVPYARIAAIACEAPADLRDQVWMPANFTWTNGGTAIGFIPTRYPGSAASEDDAILLGRRTDWQDLSDEWSLPLGQRVLVTDVEETALMDLRSLALSTVDTGPA